MTVRLEPLVTVSVLVLGTSIVGCASEPESREKVEARAEDLLPPELASARTPVEELEIVLALGRSRPGRLPVEAWNRAEEAIRAFLPPLEGALEGASWRVIYTDLPRADYLAVDLMDGTSDEAERRAWFHLVYLPDPLPGEPFDGEPLAGFPTSGEPGRYLRLRAGTIDLLAVPEEPGLAEEESLRELVSRFDLEGLAALEPDLPRVGP